MSPHWTYAPCPRVVEDLQQGDILRPTEELRGLLREVHPHFCDPKYLAFIVATQSCDLVRRRRSVCGAEYINIAVIRDLKDILKKQLDATCDRIADGVYSADKKLQARQLLERTLNQNEQASGWFYLHPDADSIGIGVHAVALLRVSVAVRSQEHYDLLLQCRSGRLQATFQNKLGWLVGNLYSRVGTPDWADHEGGESAQSKVIREMISSQEWVNTRALENARREGVDFSVVPREEVVRTVEKYKPPLLKNRLIDEVRQQTSRILENTSFLDIDDMRGVSPEALDRIRRQLADSLAKIPDRLANRLQNNARFSSVRDSP